MQHSQGGNQAWTQNLNQDSLAEEPGDDVFSKFLELDGDFTQFETGDTQNGPSGLDTPMGRLNFAQDGPMQPLSPQQQAILQSMQMNLADMASNMDFLHANQQQQQHQHPHTQQFQQYAAFPQMQNPFQHQIPPTPVSAEMCGTKYTSALDSAGQIIFDRQNATFTPLVSPAQTPIENPWGMPDYVVADDFFSPLTSPAIEAQQHYTSTNATSSPIDLALEQQPGTARKSRRKLNPASRVASTRSLRNSPATKASTRRSQASNSSRGSQAYQSETDRPRHLLPTAVASTGVSSEDSVSPEALSESLMRPPPIPAGRTPGSLRQVDDGTMPATPATLMRLPGKQTDIITSGEHTDSLEIMEDIALPAAAADLPARALPGISTTFPESTHDDSSTPTMSAKTPKLSADSTPRSAGTRPPSGSNDLPRSSRGGRPSKKRPSISQVTVSPALRPKISPSISPLVSRTGPGIPVSSAETSALYLASKSNYQNIIDGTHLPGVSYPETLAENLSSKRTSHKIAEQGRRNRINLALKEIESLLPPEMAATARKDKAMSKEECAADKSAAAQGASKASTVEMAIAYIKSLQAELRDTKDKLEVAEKSLADEAASGSQTSGRSSAS